jgi:hypothetical protein
MEKKFKAIKKICDLLSLQVIRESPKGSVEILVMIDAIKTRVYNIEVIMGYKFI